MTTSMLPRHLAAASGRRSLSTSAARLQTTASSAISSMRTTAVAKRSLSSARIPERHWSLHSNDAVGMRLPTEASSNPSWRLYASSAKPEEEDDDRNNNNNTTTTNPPKPLLTRLEDANPERHPGIVVNPDGLGSHILPGNLIYKTYQWSGNTRKVPLELAHGYFWMVRDLKATHQKPTLSNPRLIPADQARVFPTLQGLTTLDDLSTPVDLPWVFLERAHGLGGSGRKARKTKKKPSSSGGGGKITLVAISFRDNGFQVIPTWTEPFAQAFADTHDQDKIQVFRVSITERWALYPIRNTIKRVMQSNTPVEQHATTLAHFDTQEVLEFRDVLRMHNVMAGYVFLLDDRGRVRFAGSGEASSQEVQQLVGLGRELMAEQSTGSSRGSKPRTKPSNRRR